MFNLYAAYITQNAGLDEAQAAIKIAGRNMNNIRYVDVPAPMAETEEELKSEPLDESERGDLKTSTATMENSVEIP